MTLEGFIRSREASWRELEVLIESAGGKAESLGTERAMRLGTLYRSVAADLSLARSRFPREAPRRRLERITGDASALVYRGRSERGSAREFLTRTYWVRVAERPRPLSIAALLLLVPGLLAALWAGADPEAALRFVPEQFQGATDPPRTDGGTVSRETAFSAFLFTNNIRVTIIAFALGITAGIGTAMAMAFNGLLLGAVAGLAVQAGNGRAFLEFFIPHGPIELSCIVVAGAAGLRLGWAIVNPGHLQRGKAIASEGRKSVEIILGTMPWLIAAGISEAFVRGSGLPLAALMTIGLGLFFAFWGLVWWRGWRVVSAGA